MPSPLNEQKKRGEQFSTPINYFIQENLVFKKLSPTERFHIERHIYKASFTELKASLRRQMESYRRSKEDYSYWEENPKHRHRPECGRYYPCLDCLRIAKKLGINSEKV